MERKLEKLKNIVAGIKKLRFKPSKCLGETNKTIIKFITLNRRYG